MSSDRHESSSAAGLAQAEAQIEAHSAGLKKELGVRDLALTQILYIVGLTWIGVAGRLGPSHVIFWENFWLFLPGMEHGSPESLSKPKLIFGKTTWPAMRLRVKPNGIEPCSGLLDACTSIRSTTATA